MCTHNHCFEQKYGKKNITCFHLKIIIFTALKNLSILHRRVFLMAVHLRVVSLCLVIDVSFLH